MAVLFLCWVVFFDKNSIRELQLVKAEIAKLESEKAFYKNKIKQDSLVIKNINNKDFLEKYAREQFMMKKADEFMFVVEPESAKPTN